MTTSATDAPLTVSTDGTAGPYVIVTPEQLRPVLEALRADGIRSQVDDEAVHNGTQALAVIELGENADVQRVQKILDRVAATTRNGKHRRRSVTQKVLVIWGDPEKMGQFKIRLDGEAVGGWVRQPDIEERFRKTLPGRTLTYCFSKRVLAIDCKVAVLMQGRSSKVNGEKLSVSRVVALEDRRALDRAECNKVITDIHENLIEPLSREFGLRVLNYDAHVESDLEHMLSSEALTRLEEFSAIANKSILHKIDLQRWSAFIRQAHQDDAVIDPNPLAKWLGEDGFSEQNSARLVEEYELGRRILSEYDAERQ